MWRTFKRFWNAEEVPRWFGLSLVLVYMFGLGGGVHFGISQARRDAKIQLKSSSAYAVRQLARRLSSIEGAEPEDPTLIAAYRRALREFAANVPVRSARVVDQRGRVIASTRAAEIGGITDEPIEKSSGPKQLEVTSVPVTGQNEPDWYIRTPIVTAVPPIVRPGDSPGAGSPGSDDQKSEVPPEGEPPTAMFLAVQLGPDPYGPWGLGDHVGLLTSALVVLGALFVIYRRLREQMRGLARIGERLESHRGRIEQDLASLRIADLRNHATAAWNELVDLAEHLANVVERTEANDELSAVLKHSGGSALAEALNAIPDGIIYITGDNRFDYVNSTICRLLGWDADQARQSTLTEAHAECVGGEVLELLRDARQPEGFFEARTELLDAADRRPPHDSSYRVWVIPLRPAQHEGEAVVVIRDVSRQVRAERAREEFVTQVTHELRTPLTNIRAYAETLSSGMFDDPKVITDCYNVITKETRRLSRLIDDVLSVSQMEVGSIELKLDSVDPRALLSDGIHDIRGLADEKNIDIQLVLPAKLEAIRADRDKLAVVVNNLLGNAVKYTPAGGNVFVGCQITEQAVTITVKDNGIGIDPADHPRVFEKFQRADDPAVKEETGSGIGLFTAREIVRRHGGDIELISKKGEGSTFVVRLPHRLSRATAMATAQET